MTSPARIALAILLLLGPGAPAWASGPFAAYEDAAAEGHAPAADALLPLLDHRDPAVRGRAHALLGAHLDALGHPYAALLAHARALQDGHEPAVAPALALLDRVGDAPLVADALGREPPAGADPDTDARVRLLAARARFRQGDYDAVLALLDAPSTAGRPEALALRGNALNQLGRPTDALPALLTAQAASADDRERFHALVTLDLARTWFAAGNFPKAIQAYAAVDPGSPYWPQATFERAWAHFRLQDMRGTLSLLFNHRTAFLEDWFLPEADLLRTYALFLLCRFPDADREITAFTDRFEPAHARLGRGLGNLGPVDAYDDVVALAAGEPTRLPPGLLRPFSWEDRMTAARRSVSRIDDERARLPDAPWAQVAGAWLDARRDDLVRTEGERVLARARAAEAQLADMLQNVRMTKLDILQFETQMYERAAVTGELPTLDAAPLRQRRRAPRARTWPYQGEDWADELGSYRVREGSGCPDDLRVGG